MLIDEEIKAFEACISGRALLDEGSDLEVLDVVTDPHLSMVLPVGEVSITRRRRTEVSEDSPKNLTWNNPRNYIDTMLEASEDRVELCEDDPDEASKEMKRSMFQMNTWTKSYNKAIKSAKGRLRQAIESLDHARGIEASLVSEERVWVAKLAAKEREKVELKVSYQAQFDNECKVTVKLKEFVEKGYNPDTLEPFPVSPELVVEDDLQIQEGDADVIGGADG
ncbi:hypothetical protein GIB67_028558, partial [Kingdonia uniflora]